MQIKAWRDIATPHDDVLSGNFLQSEFAADLMQVVRGKGIPEYQDAGIFYQRTYITEGMHELLEMVTKRVAGKGGDPVVQLQTGFGGGKTHSLLAIYHLLKATDAKQLNGISNVLQKNDIEQLPQTNIVVLDGNSLSPSEPRKYGNIAVNTLCGELAYRLGGAEAYELVKKSDQDGTSPGKTILADLLEKYAPCVILIDELVLYMRQLSTKQLAGGTLDSNISFIQALTEAIKSVPTAMLLVSLPESEVEAGSATGEQVLGILSHIFERVQKIWRNMSAEEAYKVVTRRLFKNIADADCQKACSEISRWYQENTAEFPTQAAQKDYETQLRDCYPFHPELLTQLYTEWGALSNFQQTRGVLKLMAPIIHYLWANDNRNELIMAGDLPLNDGNCRSGFTSYLNESHWNAVIDNDIDGNENTISRKLERDNETLGRNTSCRRVARAIFLATAPSFRDNSKRGTDKASILLASVLPSHSPSSYNDALNALNAHCHYLNELDGHYWFGTHQNLQRKMEDHKRTLEDEPNVFPEIKKHLQRKIGKIRNSFFDAVHVFTFHADIPDDTALRLVVLPPSSAYSHSGNNLASNAATEILNKRGNHPRVYKNNILFLAIGYDYVSRLKDITRELLAWEHIQTVEEITDTTQVGQIRSKILDACNKLEKILEESYCWLLAPSSQKENLISVQIRQQRENYADNLQECCEENEWVICQWSPIHLKPLLEKHYWKDTKEDLTVETLWQNMRQFSYFPRLQNKRVLQDTITEGGKSREYFGIAAQGQDDNGDYIGFSFGSTALTEFFPNTLMLISPEKALQYEELQRQRYPSDDKPEEDVQEESTTGSGGATTGGSSTITGGGGTTTGGGGTTTGSGGATTKPTEKNFYGFKKINPTKMVTDVGDINDEILTHFTKDMNNTVEITLEIKVTNNNGFSKELKRTIEENTATLNFEATEFSED